MLTSYAGKHEAGVTFCSSYGSAICGFIGDEIRGVTLGCVNGDPNITLSRHIYVGSKASWEVIAKGIPNI